ncbi:MAG: hypothetical protein EOP45_07215 [Sphingobacteriaceae bacterium]|nr:MAG: hypothetical protein EOP45_07215 [Sphingobacteriaceae bacterium]
MNLLNYFDHLKVFSLILSVFYVNSLSVISSDRDTVSKSLILLGTTEYQKITDVWNEKITATIAPYMNEESPLSLYLHLPLHIGPELHALDFVLEGLSTNELFANISEDIFALFADLDIIVVVISVNRLSELPRSRYKKFGM